MQDYAPMDSIAKHRSRLRLYACLMGAALVLASLFATPTSAEAAVTFTLGNIKTSASTSNQGWGLAVADDGTQYATDQAGNSIYVYDDAGALLHTITECGSPRGVALKPDGLLVATCFTGHLVRTFDPTNNWDEVVADQFASTMPFGVAVDSAGKIAVSAWFPQGSTPKTVAYVYDDPNDASPRQLKDPSDGLFNQGVAFGPGGDVFVAQKGTGVLVFAPGADTVNRTIAVAGDAEAVAADPLGNVYATVKSDNKVNMYAPDSDTLLQSIGPASGDPGYMQGPTAIAVNSNTDVFAGLGAGNTITQWIPSPTGIGLNPAMGSTDGGTQVAIQGLGLDNTTGVTFGGLPAAYTQDSPTQVTATAPALPGISALSTSVDVTVTTPYGSTTLPDAYTYETTPPDPDTTLTVKARAKAKQLKPGKRTKVVRSAETNAQIKKVKTHCYLFGDKLTGKDKRAVCKFKKKKTTSNAKVWVKPQCSVGVKVRVKIVANETEMDKATWQRTWKVKNKPRTYCPISGNG